MMSPYEKRIRERFPALAADAVWPVVQRMLDEAELHDHDEFWFDGVQQQCIDLSRRLGLLFEPAQCVECEKDWPEAGDGLDGGPCPRCVEQRKAEAEQRQAEFDAMTPEERAEQTRVVQIFISGLVSRDVQ